MRYVILLCLTAGLIACNRKPRKEDHQIIEVQKTSNAPTLDGIATENCWNRAAWHSLDQNWSGPVFTHEDFNGRYKLCWDETALFVLVEITDDSLEDRHSDPLKLYWDDDCLEAFVDEDNSGGLHQYNYNAFAYHIGLDSSVVDLGPDREARLFKNHIAVSRKTKGVKSLWELAIILYPDTYSDTGRNTPVTLEKGKKIGFALAYCDNDGSEERENFIGSVFVPGEDKDQGWIDADIFGTLILKE